MGEARSSGWRGGEHSAHLDFDAYRDAVLARDAERGLAFYAPDAEWIEYRHQDPPCTPNIMRGRAAIGAFLRRIATTPIRLSIDNEVIDDHRAAYTLTVIRPDGGRITENVILSHGDGYITHQLDVEAWD